MDVQQLASQVKAQGDVLEKIAEFANQLAADNAELSNELERLKTWIRGTIAQTLEEAKNQLTVEVHAISAEAVDEARARQRRAEKEVADLEQLLMTGGKTKMVKLIRDGNGQVHGAAVHESG